MVYLVIPRSPLPPLLVIPRSPLPPLPEGEGSRSVSLLPLAGEGQGMGA